MTKGYQRHCSTSNGFSNPEVAEAFADVEGKHRRDRRMSACGFPIDEEEHERRMAIANEQRAILRQLVGNEHALLLLLNVIEGTLGLRSLAEQTGRNASVFCRRLPNYLRELKAAAIASPELRSEFERLLGRPLPQNDDHLQDRKDE